MSTGLNDLLLNTRGHFEFGYFFFLLHIQKWIVICAIMAPLHSAFEFVSLQVRAAREGCSTHLYPPAEDRAIQDPTPRGCWEVRHGDSPGGWDGCQPQSAW